MTCALFASPDVAPPLFLTARNYLKRQLGLINFDWKIRRADRVIQQLIHGQIVVRSLTTKLCLVDMTGALTDYDGTYAPKIRGETGCTPQRDCSHGSWIN